MPEFVAPTHRKALGQYMTPGWIAQQMCSSIERPATQWRVIDPACGDGNLLLAAAEAMRTVGVQGISSRLSGIEIDSNLAATARARIAAFLGCPERSVDVLHGDFLKIANADLFAASSFLGNDGRFNVVLANPPYGAQREYRFFETSAKIVPPGGELVFLMPLASMERLQGPDASPLRGRPMDVTTGHVILHHVVGKPFSVRPLRVRAAACNGFSVLSGLKLYEEGAGIPKQSREIINAKPFSSPESLPGWIPCLRTGDVKPYHVSLGRFWVNYGLHLAHPKELGRFSGPRVILRRMPVWRTGRLAAAFVSDVVLGAGDLLIIKHESHDPDVLKGLCVFLNSESVRVLLTSRRPTLEHRMSFRADPIPWTV